MILSSLPLASGIKSIRLLRALRWLMLSALLACDAVPAAGLRWEKRGPLPNLSGVAGAFAEVSREMLLIAVGVNFPDRKPWESGAKIWSARTR